jgi:hypothetical protein
MAAIKHKRAIQDAIRAIVNPNNIDTHRLVYASVLSVDMDSYTCNVQAIVDQAETEIPGVSLMADIEDGVLYQPTVGSTVVVAWSDKLEPFVAFFSSIDNMYFWSQGQIQLNDGTFEGLVKVVPLTQALNALQNDINNLKQVFAAMAPGLTTYGIGGDYTGYAAQYLHVTEQSEIENTKITHGTN